VGEWVLRKPAVRYALAWSRAHQKLRCSNLSSRQLQKAALPIGFPGFLEDTGFPPTSLVLESPTGLLMQGPARKHWLPCVNWKAMECRHRAGMILVPAFSSLGYLHRYPCISSGRQKLYLRKAGR